MKEHRPVESTNVSFIGTGRMGLGMARNLLKAGYPLTVCNRTPAKAQPLVEAGASLALTPREATTGADIIISMVGDDRDSREVWLGTDGVLAGELKEGVIAVEDSTLSFGYVRELHEALTAAGLAYIDSPVTGGLDGAAAGTLTLLVGAADEDLDRARPVLDAYSRNIIHFGPPGAGTAYKLVVNLMVGVQATALAEGLLLAEKCGLNVEQVIEGLTTGSAGSPVVKAWVHTMAGGDHAKVSHFLARWMHKDMVYAVRMAGEKGQFVPTSAVATQVFQRALDHGFAESNATAVIEGLR